MLKFFLNLYTSQIKYYLKIKYLNKSFKKKKKFNLIYLLILYIHKINDKNINKK